MDSIPPPARVLADAGARPLLPHGAAAPQSDYRHKHPDGVLRHDGSHRPSEREPHMASPANRPWRGRLTLTIMAYWLWLRRPPPVAEAQVLPGRYACVFKATPRRPGPPRSVQFSGGLDVAISLVYTDTHAPVREVQVPPTRRQSWIIGACIQQPANNPQNPIAILAPAGLEPSLSAANARAQHLSC